MFQNITGVVLKANQLVKVLGFLQSDNIATTVGEVGLIPSEDVVLYFQDLSWQLGSCASTDCGVPLLGSGQSALSPQGLSLGDLYGGFSPNRLSRESFNGNVVLSLIACPSTRSELLESEHERCIAAYKPELFGLISCRDIYINNTSFGLGCAQFSAARPMEKLGYFATIVALLSALFVVLRWLWRKIRTRKGEA